MENAELAQHCAALAISESSAHEFSELRLRGKGGKIRNGTLTLVRSNGELYGITAWHVIDSFRSLTGPKTMGTVARKPYVLKENFLRCPEIPSGRPLDVGICKLEEAILSATGKEPLVLGSTPGNPQGVDRGYAVGFPEDTKEFSVHMFQRSIATTALNVVAETSGLPAGTFNMFSALDTTPSHTNWSGMSGGPIFWVDGQGEYGIFGIVSEGMYTPSQNGAGGNVHLIGELASPAEIERWIRDLRI